MSRPDQPARRANGALPCRTPRSCGELFDERPSGRVEVFGRLLHVTPTRLVLADAVARLDVLLAPSSAPVAAALGAWVVVSGQLAGEELADAQLIEQHPGKLPARGEFMRFARLGDTLHRVARGRAAVRAFFEQRGFVETTTPYVVDAPGTDPYIEPHRTERGWLRTSPEFHMKRLLAGGFSRIYQVAPCARQEELGPWHQPEFTLVEWYRSFADVEQVMADTEQLIRHVVKLLTGGTTITRDAQRIDVEGPFLRLSVRDAFARFAGIDDASALARDDEARYFACWVEHVEPALRHSSQPVFVTEYPSSQAALARKKRNDPGVAERFELYLAGVELCNGYGELVDPVEQRLRFEHDRAVRAARQLADLPIDEPLLLALEEGLPPCAGNALGLERLLALTLGASLADVMAFPAEA